MIIIIVINLKKEFKKKMYRLVDSLVFGRLFRAVLFGLTRWLPGIPTNFGFNNCLFFGALISATDPGKYDSALLIQGAL